MGGRQTDAESPALTGTWPGLEVPCKWESSIVAITAAFQGIHWQEVRIKGGARTRTQESSYRLGHLNPHTGC